MTISRWTLAAQSRGEKYGQFFLTLTSISTVTCRKVLLMASVGEIAMRYNSASLHLDRNVLLLKQQRGIPVQVGPIGVMLRVVPKKMSMGSCAFRGVRREPPNR